jgi:serine/threonine protein kinase
MENTMSDDFNESSSYVPSYTTQQGHVFRPNDVIDGKYILMHPLGSGGIGQVWLAYHRLAKFPLAIKFTPFEDSAAAQEEFQILSQIYHPSIVRTFDMGFAAENELYLSMEFIEGPSLFDIHQMELEAKPDSSTILTWLRDIVGALSYLHQPEIGEIHKDIKPGNIIGLEDSAKLIDFNIAGPTTHPHAGTLPWKCPIQYQHDIWTTYADVWATAVTFYELITQRESPLFAHSDPRFEVELTDSCPSDFPKSTFNAICNIIRGSGFGDSEYERIQPGRVIRGEDTVSHLPLILLDTDPSNYHNIFALPQKQKKLTEVPKPLREKYKISSKRQHFITISLINQTDKAKARAREPLLKEALNKASLPASSAELKKFKPTFGELFKLNVIEYRGKARPQKVALTDQFLKDLEPFQV